MSNLNTDCPWYREGDITIYLGNAEDILPSIDQTFDLIFTSPPYNLGNTTGGGFPTGNSKGKWAGFPQGYGLHADAMPWDQYISWQHQILSRCWEMLNINGAIFYNHKPRTQDGVQLHPRIFIPEHIPIRQELVWAKSGGINASVRHYCATYELIIILAKPDFRLRSKGASMVGDLWRFSQESKTEHPAPFPIALPSRAIETTGAQSVLDPFCGSGTTLRAAKDRGIGAVGIDIEERYCEMALRRLGQGVLFPIQQ